MWAYARDYIYDHRGSHKGRFYFCSWGCLRERERKAEEIKREKMCAAWKKAAETRMKTIEKKKAQRAQELEAENEIYLETARSGQNYR